MTSPDAGPADEQDAVPGVHPALEPLAWLIGVWEGVGALVYPTIEDRNYVQRVEFSSDGRPFLHYSSRSWLLEDDGSRGRPGASEEGFWRPGAEKFDVEVLLSHPFGVAEVLVGRVAFKKVELVSDAIVRTATAKEVTATTRLYGGVEGDLAYVVEMAAVGQALQPHLSARLQRVRE
ncbi:MAG TPA: FABP family protein [Mycobacteriales bacterium]|nr:FABP family protein [Mycobacteriales bacterium]